MVGAFGGCNWFAVVDLLGTYLPAGIIGGKPGAVRPRRTEETEAAWAIPKT